MGLISGGNSLNKEDLLICYHKACEDALKRRVVKSGWAKAGLWPVDVTVPLANPRPMQPAAEAIKAARGELESHQDDEDIFKTPARGTEVRKQVVELAKGGVLDRRAQGLVMQKVSKALDRKNAEIWD
jgi:hypothetical protein